MIIDCHTHLGASWLGQWKSEIDEEGFLDYMDQWNIDLACINYWGIAYDPHIGNDKISDFVKANPQRLIGFSCIIPSWGEEAVLEMEKAVKNPQMKGIKLHPAINKYYVDSPVVNPIMEMAVAADMPLLFHCGADEYSHPRKLGHLAQQFKQAKIIMGHMGEEAVVEGIQVAKENPNIFLDTAGSYNRYNIMVEAINYVGEERILFGTDFPAYNPGPEISKVRDAKITARQKELIFGLNAARLLNLKK